MDNPLISLNPLRSLLIHLETEAIKAMPLPHTAASESPARASVCNRFSMISITF